MKVNSTLLAAAALVVFTGGAVARDLTVVSWGGSYQDAQKRLFFAPFTAETKIPLVDEPWDGGVGTLRAKVQSGKSDWDVVEVESDELAVGCEEGLYEKLDWDKIGGKDAYIPDAFNDCGIGAIFYDFVLGYDKDKLQQAPTGWVDFFDLKKYPGKRALRGGPKTTLEIALMGDGVAPKDVYKVLATPEGVDRAFKKLDTIKSDIIFWKAGAQPPQLLASGEVALTSAYNGRIDAANLNDHRNFGMVWNGALYTMDSWVILKGSPNLDGAYKFLDFVGRPEIEAKLPDAIAYGVPNKQANALINPDRLKMLGTAPENLANAVPINVAFWLENFDRLSERFNQWAAQK